MALLHRRYTCSNAAGKRRRNKYSNRTTRWKTSDSAGVLFRSRLCGLERLICRPKVEASMWRRSKRIAAASGARKHRAQLRRHPRTSVWRRAFCVVRCACWTATLRAGRASSSARSLALRLHNGSRASDVQWRHAAMLLSTHDSPGCVWCDDGYGHAPRNAGYERTTPVRRAPVLSSSVISRKAFPVATT